MIDTKTTLDVNGRSYRIYSLEALAGRHDISRLPYSLKILLENLLRHEDGVNITREDIRGAGGPGPEGQSPHGKSPSPPPAY